MAQFAQIAFQHAKILNQKEWLGLMKNVLISVVLLAVLAVGGFLYWQTTPDFTLSQIKAGIKEHDVEKFKKFVDVHSVSASIVDGVVSKPVQGLMGDNIFAKMLFSGFMGFVKPELINSFEEDILNWVATGSGKQKYQSQSISASGPSFSTFSKSMGLNRKKFKAIKNKTESGDSALVTLHFTDKETSGEFDLVVKMLKDESSWPTHWKIVSIENCADILLKLSEAEGSRQRIQIQNEPVEIN